MDTNSTTPHMQIYSCQEEEFLVAGVRIEDYEVFQVLKRAEQGPVLLAWYDPMTRKESLVDLQVFIETLQRAGKEIEALKAVDGPA